MKEIKAWRTSDGATFFDIMEARKHEDIVIQNSVREKLRELFSKWSPGGLSETQTSDSLALYVIENVRDFALAISPLITKREEKERARDFKIPISHEMGD